MIHLSIVKVIFFLLNSVYIMHCFAKEQRMSSYDYVKDSNGKTYVYENTTYWDKESKTCKHHRWSIGHLDPDTREIVPNHRKGDKQTYNMSVNASDTSGHCVVAATGIEKLLSQVVADMKLAAPLKLFSQRIGNVY